MGIWMAASLQKKMDLARTAFTRTPMVGNAFDSGAGPVSAHDWNKTGITNPNANAPFFTAFLEPALAIIGHEHKIYHAYPSSARGDITILGPDARSTNL
jgi:hypothetical protein